jgi:AAA family ATP:ADP antiporter
MKKAKPKMSLKDSLLFIARSKYMLCVATIVIAYGISINLVEVTWKGQLKLAYPTPNEYSTFMGNFSRMTGMATIFMMFFVTGNVVRKLGWRIAALITPVVLLITGAGFFGFMLFGDALAGWVTYLGTTPLMMAVVFGTIQNIASKSSKYSLFDPTKEMTYIPLDQEYKVKGKAAIDVTGARFGKSGGAFIQQVLIITLGSISAITPYIGVILLAIIVAWILAANSLSKQFAAVSAEKDAKDAETDRVKASSQAAERTEAVRT